MQPTTGGTTPNRRRLWDDSADRELRRRANANETVGQIAKALGRTVDAVRGRASRLDIVVSSSLRPWRQFQSRERKARKGGSSH